MVKTFLKKKTVGFDLACIDYHLLQNVIFFKLTF